MNPTLIQVDQGTDEWLEARLGRATASRFADVLAVTRSGTEGAGRRNYRADLIIERLKGKLPERFKSAAMEWGTETEPLARVKYELATKTLVEETGFYQHPTLMAGASPDGLIGADGLLEIKSPNTATHIETLQTRDIPTKYVPQVQGQMWITGRAWCDFVSFEPDFPDNAQLFIKRVHRDNEFIHNLEQEVRKFLDEVSDGVGLVKNWRR